MKKTILMVAFALLTNGLVLAAERSSTQKELDALMNKVSNKALNGKKAEADFADELKQFDTLLAKHKGEKTEEVAQVAFMKAIVYFQHLDNVEKATEIIQKLKTDFPDSPQARNAEATLKTIKLEGEGRKAQRSLVEGAVFPTFSENDINGRPLGITKDKVVLVQFWAAWSQPSTDELPHLKAAYDKYHSKGFEIVGVSVDTANDKDKVTALTAKQNLPWPQYFDGQGWNNKLALKYGVKTIPTTYLVDGKGNIIAKDLRGPALEDELARALNK